MRPSHNLPLPPRIYPPFQQLYATLPESTHPPPEYTPIFNNYKIMRPSQNLLLPPRIFFSSGSKWSILSQLQKRLEKGA